MSTYLNAANQSYEVMNNCSTNFQMEFVRMAERQNSERAQRHKKYRRKDWIIACTCFAIATSIYGYTMYAIKQERFLDDFEMPDPLAEDSRAKKLK